MSRGVYWFGEGEGKFIDGGGRGWIGRVEEQGVFVG